MLHINIKYNIACYIKIIKKEHNIFHENFTICMYIIKH